MFAVGQELCVQSIFESMIVCTCIHRCNKLTYHTVCTCFSFASPGYCINIGRNLSPPDGTVVAEFEGPSNVSFNCDQFSNFTVGNETGQNFTQRTTQWSFRLASNPGVLTIYNNLIHLEFEVSGTIRNVNNTRFPTFQNMLTIVNFTERLDGTRLICGQGFQLEVNEWTLRIYRKLTT